MLTHLSRHSDGVDKVKHIYFDVKDALCSGTKKDLDYHGRDWVSENHLNVGRDIEEHADFSNNLAIASLIEDPDWDHAAPNCIGNTADVVAGMATKKLVRYKRTDFPLTPPVKIEENFKKHPHPASRAELASHFVNPKDASERPPKRPIFLFTNI